MVYQTRIKVFDSYLTIDGDYLFKKYRKGMKTGEDVHCSSDLKV